MKLTHRRAAVASFALTGLLLIVAHLLACYPEPTPDAPRCEEHGVLIDAAPDSSACVFAQLRVRRFVQVFRSKPGFDVERIRGFSVVVPHSSDGASFDNGHGIVGGDTRCDVRVIRLASVHLHDLPHELAHAAEGCARDETAATVYAQTHPRWTERGVLTDIFMVENG